MERECVRKRRERERVRRNERGDERKSGSERGEIEWGME
jgi:hypothetical protein